MDKLTTIDPQIENEELLALKRQVASLAEKLDRLQTEMARLTGAAAPASPLHEELVRPEVLVIIAAAVSSFLGKKIRIRSAKMLQSPYEIVNPWSQQGRVSVQASHTLRWER
jgi:hypothetical protein